MADKQFSTYTSEQVQITEVGDGIIPVANADGLTTKGKITGSDLANDVQLQFNDYKAVYETTADKDADSTTYQEGDIIFDKETKKEYIIGPDGSAGSADLSSGGAGAFELSGTVIKETGLTGTSTNDFVVGADDPYNTTSGVRMFFDTSKGAFRAGFYDDSIWNEANIGSYSTALGSYTTASGYFTTASGYYTTASGSSSVALGNSATASGSSSIALGYGIIASAYYSVALGSYTTASTDYSTIVGRYGQTDTDTAFAVAYGDPGDQNTVGAGLQFEVKQDGRIKMNNLPTSSTGLTAGDLWNNGGVINIV